MKALWLIVVILGLLYVAIWAATKERELPPAGSNQTTSQSATSQEPPDQVLVGVARGDALTRVPAGARVELVSATPRLFAGEDLKEALPGAPGAQPGFVIVLSAQVDNRQVSQLTYHAVPPGRVVFVTQKNS